MVVVCHDTRDEVLDAIASLPETGLERVVVDAGSTDGTVAALRAAHPDLRVRSLSNVGFGRAANVGIRATQAPTVVVANADVRFTPGTLDILRRRFHDDAEVAAIGPRVTYPDGRIQASARRHPDVPTAIGHAVFGRVAPGNPWTRRYHQRDADPDQPRDVDWLSGCALALRRSAVDEIGGFDPGYFLYVEDVDLGQRLRAAGWRVRYEPAAQVVHGVGASTGQRRLWALTVHASSLDRYLASGLRGPARLVRPFVPLALAGWVALTWISERFARDGRSTTGERPT